MPSVERDIVIACTPEEFLDYVMDIERYAEIDDKLRAFDWVKRERDFVEFKFRPRLPGVPGPAPMMVAQGRRTPGERVDVTLSPPPSNKIFHRVMVFNASFEVRAVQEGTQVLRRFDVALRSPARWLLEPVLRRTLPPDIEAELRGAKAVMESRQ